MPDRYAVIGHPVAHSKSPLIHAEFARQTGERIKYAALLAPLDGFLASVRRFREEGGKGVNVTLPFKIEAWQFASRRTARAQDAQAANILKFEAGGEVLGDNSDGAGLMCDIQSNLGFPVRGRRALLMGAGGAAQGVVGPLLDAAPACLVIANRTAEKADGLVRRFATRSHTSVIVASTYAALTGQVFDLVINATASSLNEDDLAFPNGIFSNEALAYDMMYGKGLTPFLQRAKSEGAARLADGIGMLVEQAAESFLVWRGVRPQTDALIAKLKAL